jgi:hypothetical protein
MVTTCRAGLAVIVVGLSLATLDARQTPAGRQPSGSASVAPAPEVFCNTMQAGTLCPTGTVSILKLSGPKVQQWMDVINKYNGAVESATKQLKTEAKSVLTPAQIAELDRWMATGINPEVNRILASRNPIAR